MFTLGPSALKRTAAGFTIRSAIVAWLIQLIKCGVGPRGQKGLWTISIRPAASCNKINNYSQSLVLTVKWSFPVYSNCSRFHTLRIHITTLMLLFAAVTVKFLPVGLIKGFVSIRGSVLFFQLPRGEVSGAKRGHLLPAFGPVWHCCIVPSRRVGSGNSPSLTGLTN